MKLDSIYKMEMCHVFKNIWENQSNCMLCSDYLKLVYIIICFLLQLKNIIVFHFINNYNLTVYEYVANGQSRMASIRIMIVLNN